MPSIQGINSKQTRVREIKLKTEQRNCANKAGAISKHVATWQQIISDQWILKTVLGVSIEIEDSKGVHLEKILFRKEFKRPSELGVAKEVKSVSRIYIINFLEGQKK